jgi:hypothetical protein
LSLFLAESERRYSTPFPARKQAGNQSLQNGENIDRSTSQSCAAKMAAFPVRGGGQWGVPLGVGGPPAGNFIFWWADQDRQDTQDTQDGGKVGLRASERLAAIERLSGQEMACELAKDLRAYAPSRRSPGSHGCPGCLGQGTGHAKRPSACPAIGPPPIRGAGRAANVSAAPFARVR